MTLSGVVTVRLSPILETHSHSLVSPTLETHTSLSNSTELSKRRVIHLMFIDSEKLTTKKKRNGKQPGR
jgi:hypothetical protein